MQSLWQDLRYSARILFKRPGFSSIAIVTLALGIGANTMLFSLVNVVVFRPSPFRSPEQLVIVRETSAGVNRGGLTPAKFLWLKEHPGNFDSVAASLRSGFSLANSEGPESAFGFRVSAGFFDLLGVPPALGRTFLPGEDQPGAERVVVLSHRLWQRLSGDPGLIGQKLKLGDEYHTVIGVMPPEFYFISRNTDIFVPFQFSHEHLSNPNSQRIQVMARLKPGVTLRQAEAELAGIVGKLEEEFPTGLKEPGMRASSLDEEKRHPGYLSMLLALQGAAGCVLLIACANLANLLLVRANMRSREFAVRAALGASWGRIIRQLLTESMLLAVLGGSLGLLLAAWSLDLVYAALPENFVFNLPLSDLEKLSVDRGVLLFTLGVSVLSGLVFGLAPALSAARRDLAVSLKDSALFSGATMSRNRLTRLLVVGEIALSLVLSVGAGLLLKSFAGMLRTEMGFNSDHVFRVGIELRPQKYPEPAQRLAALKQAVERTRSLPGVVSATLSDHAYPVSGANDRGSLFAIEGRPESPAGAETRAEIYSVDPDYFRTLQIPILQGRRFTETDTTASLSVVIVSQSLAKRYWPEENPIGKFIRLNVGQPNARASAIVGISGDLRNPLALNEQQTIYYPLPQGQPAGGWIIVRTPIDLVESVCNEIRALDPDRPVFGIADYQEMFDDMVSYPRFSTSLLGLFAGLALLLAALGIYVVMHYWVVQRVYEIAVRMALGAQTHDVLKLVIGQGIKLAVAGLVLGLGGALVLTRLLKSQLYGVSATDPVTFVTIVILLAAVALLACWIPARRATKVDPIIALRSE